MDFDTHSQTYEDLVIFTLTKGIFSINFSGVSLQWPFPNQIESMGIHEEYIQI